MDGDPMKWFRIYHDLVDDPKVQRLPGETFKFWINLLCLASRSDERGSVNMKAEDIAFALRMDDDVVADMLADLLERGLVHENEDMLEIHNWHGRQYESDSSTERVRKHREAKQGRNAPETLQKRSRNVTSSVSVSESASESVLSERFDRFWDAYPRKEDKKRCKAWWMRRKPDDELTDLMIAAVQAQARAHKWTPERKQFIPMPSTWLNGERWDDEVPGMPSIRILRKPASEMTEAERIRAEIDEENREKRMYGAERVQWFMAKHARLDEIEKEQGA